MKGLIRTPVLSYGYKDRTMANLNLDNYEVFLFEGLHDIKGIFILHMLFLFRSACL